MDRLEHKQLSKKRRSRRVRSVIRRSGLPRLSVHISNRNVTAQIIDDREGKTLAQVSTIGQKVEGSLSQKAAWAGKQIALAAKKTKLQKLALDRGDKAYHGRVKDLADAARAEGMEF